MASLPDSAIGQWLQQQKLVKRVCHRETTEKVHTGKESKQTYYLKCVTTQVAFIKTICAAEFKLSWPLKKGN